MEALAGRPGAEDDGEHGDSSREGGRRPADEGEPARRASATDAALGLEPRPQSPWRLDAFDGGSHQPKRALLLGEPVGELRRRADALLERGAALRRERSVGERRQLLLARLVPAPGSRHVFTSSNQS
jgi:hypothetical protein